MEDERRIDTEPDEAFEEVLGDVDTHPLLSGGPLPASTPAPAKPGPRAAPLSREEIPALARPEAWSDCRTPDPSGRPAAAVLPHVRVYEEAGRQVAAPTPARDDVLAAELFSALMSRLDKGLLRFRLDLSEAGDLGAMSLARVVAFGRLLAKRGGEMEITGAADPLALLLAAAPLNGVRVTRNRGGE